MLTIDIIINWLGTLMIILRLWHVGHRTIAITEHRHNKYLAIILALVEGGTLFSVTIGFYAALWYADLVSELDDI